MTRSVIVRLLLVIAPVAVGLAVTSIWSAVGGGPPFYVLGSLTWLPFVVGLARAAGIGPALVTTPDQRRRAAEEQQRELDEQAARHRRVLSRLDHELKNPIQGIRVALADEPSARQLASIDAQSQRLTSLITDLRRISEVEDTTLELAEIDVTALVQEAMAGMRELPDATGRRISVALPRAPRPLPTIIGDEDLLFLVLANSLSNAVKYSRADDAIEVRGRAEDDQVILEIADTGRGIAADELALVWEELGRSRESHVFEGSGLGLPLVRAIVQRHGGAVSLESWHGEGSTLTLRLPVGGPRSSQRSGRPGAGVRE